MFDLPRWMLCYVLLGFVQNGLVPVVLPLAAAPGPTSGLTYGAFAAAGIVAPFIGAWSDRRRRHRRTLAGGVGLAGLGLLAHALPGGLVQHMMSAALIGLGVASASTVATMFIVEVEPEANWDRRIGALQACLAGGQLAGLLAAGLLGLHHVGLAMLLGGGLMVIAVPLALATAPDPTVQVPRPAVRPRPARGEGASMGPQRSLHRVTRRALAGLGHSALAWFLAAWLLSYTATNGLTVMFSVALVREFHAPATWPTTAYAIGVACSLVLYRLVGRWDTRFGAWRVLAGGLGARAVLVAGMVLLVGTQGGAPSGLATLALLVCFAGTQVVWPLLSVASTTLSVTLSPARRAESVGLLNAATAVAATAGGVISGLLLRDGFVWLCVAVLGALLLTLLLLWHPHVRFESGETARAAAD